MSTHKNNKELITHRAISLPIIFIIIVFVGLFYAIFKYSNETSAIASESKLIKENIRASIIQWSQSQVDRVAARDTIISYYKCLGSPAGLSHSDCLLIIGDDGFKITVTEAINKSEASQDLKYSYLGKQNNLSPN